MAEKNETPLMRQYSEYKSQYPDAILLFRVGDFYETFGDDAIKASEALGITLTKRNNGGGSGDMPLAGFPHHALDTYLPNQELSLEDFRIVDPYDDNNWEDTARTKDFQKEFLSRELDEALIDYDEVEFLDDQEFEDFLWDRLNDAEYEVMSELGLYLEPSGQGRTGAFFIRDEETGQELAVIDFQDYNDIEYDLATECDDINQYKEKYKAWAERFKSE